MNIKRKPHHILREQPTSYTDTFDLLEALVGPFAAREIVLVYPTLLDLAQANVDDLAEVKCMGQATAARVKAAMELGRRLQIATNNPTGRMTSPRFIADMLMGEMSMLTQEEFRVVLLSTHMDVICIETVYRGNINTINLRVTEVLREAIKRNAPGIVLVHNHPSGSVEPSQEDIATTRIIIQCANMFDIEIHDHIIIGRGRYASFKERGIAF